MANWYGAARSNYVKIKDMGGLVLSLRPFPITIHTAVVGANEGKVCFLSDEPDSGGWPSFAYVEDEDGEREVEFDAANVICPYMEAGEILVMLEAGAEKLRYITGQAVAYNSEGDYCYVGLNDIYAKAAEHFVTPLSSITAASY